MRFIYYGPFSGGIEVHSAMGVGFRGREPSSDVSDPAAVAWLSGNPLFEAVPDAEPEKPKRKAGDVPENPAKAKQERGKQRRKKMDKDNKPAKPQDKPQEAPANVPDDREDGPQPAFDEPFRR